MSEAGEVGREEAASAPSPAPSPDAAPDASPSDPTSPSASEFPSATDDAASPSPSLSATEDAPPPSASPAAPAEGDNVNPDASPSSSPASSSEPAAADTETAAATSEQPSQSSSEPASSDQPSTTEQSNTQPPSDEQTVAPVAQPNADEEDKGESAAFPPGFHYPANHPDLSRLRRPFEFAPEFSSLHASFGYACQRRYNVHYIDFGVIIYASGNTVQIVDLYKEQQKDHRKKTILLGHGRDSNSGIGSLAVHPSKRFFAVGEKGAHPFIYIYSYPELKVVHILRNGTERAYADVQFSHTGSKLVSVGAEPDYTLTVWDWESERVILRTKAFSQEVFRAQFSPYSEGRLITSGSGHIRFWKMAKTFTGLKLQGSIGKFGQVELSDISSFVELPDGKVLSGAESGNMLMWDGNLIQFQVCRAVMPTMSEGEGNDENAIAPTIAPVAQRRPCHDGMIEFIGLDTDSTSGDRVVVTGGSDGFIRTWRFDQLEYAETSEEDPWIPLVPLLELQVGEGVAIRNMIRGEDHWMVQDANGGLFKVYLDLPTEQDADVKASSSSTSPSAVPDTRVQKILDCHAGPILGVAAAPRPLQSHLAVTAGADHSVRCWNVLKGSHMYSRSFNAPATSIHWSSSQWDPFQRMILVGFADGVVRCLKRFRNNFGLSHVLKPHTAPVLRMAISPDGGMLVTAGADGTLFFLTLQPGKPLEQPIPLGFVRLPTPSNGASGSGSSSSSSNNQPPPRIVSMEWSPDSSRVLVGLGADVLEYRAPSREQYGDTLSSSRDSFEISSLDCRQFRLVLRDMRPRDPWEDEDYAWQLGQELLNAGVIPGAPGSELNEDGSLRVKPPPRNRPVFGEDIVLDVASCVYNPTNGGRTFFVALDGSHILSTDAVGTIGGSITNGGAGGGGGGSSSTSGGSNAGSNPFAGPGGVCDFSGQKIESVYECRFDDDNEEELSKALSEARVASSKQDPSMTNPAPQISLSGRAGEPLRAIYLGRHVGTVHSLSWTSSKEYMLVATRNGGVQMRPMEDLNYYFYMHDHDGTANSTGVLRSGKSALAQPDRIGVVSGVSTTFDDRLLLSVGIDGQFFVHAVDAPAAVASVDRGIEDKVAELRRKIEEERLAIVKAKEEAAEKQRKEEEEQLARDLAATTESSHAKTREQKEREAREQKEREAAHKLAQEQADRDREERIRLREEKKHDPEREDENFDELGSMLPDGAPEKMLGAPLPSDKAADATEQSLEARPATALEASDILDPSSYSIEEAKLKAEEDERHELASKKKQRMKMEIAALRKEFQNLLKKNDQLDRDQRLPRTAFELDPRLREEIEVETQARLEEVRAELAWASEKYSLSLQKFRSKFLDPLLVEHMTLSAFRIDGVSVSSFRTQDLPPFLKHAIESVHKLMEQEESMRAQQEQQMAISRAMGTSTTNTNVAGGVGSGEEEKEAGGMLRGTVGGGGGLRGALKARASSAGAGSTSSSVMGGTTGGVGVRHRAAGLSEAELRKQARAERAIQLARLKASKPDKNVDDPADVAAVAYAERHMGDYKLKSDPKYIVPENQRVNAERKRRQMILLQESVHYIKMALNERFLALRDLKARIIKNLKKDNMRLRELNRLLGLDEQLYEPELDPKEWPEHRELFTRADLKRFEKEKLKEKARAANAGTRSIFSSTRGSIDEEEEEEEEDEKKQPETVETKSGASTDVVSSTPASGAASSAQPSSSTPSSSSSAPSSSSSNSDALTWSIGRTADASAPLSSMESSEHSIHRKLWLYERSSLLQKISYALHSFDQALLKLRREKLKLDADLKSTDLKVLTLYQELNLLKDFEESENRLFAKLSKARASKAAVVSEMGECEKALSHKLAEIRTWQEKDKQVMQDFNLVVGGEKSEFYPTLLKIFKKKVKRSKKKGAAGGSGSGAGGSGAGGSGGRDDDDDDNDSDDGMGGNDSDSDSDSMDGSSDESDQDDSCPLHLDSAIYEKVLELREKRLEQEEVLAEFNKGVAELNKSYERLGARERLIDKELASTEADIEAFQSEKQRALNLIQVCVPLKLHQLKFLTNTIPIPQASGSYGGSSSFGGSGLISAVSSPINGGSGIGGGAGSGAPLVKLPRDISSALIFTSTGLSRLRNRIRELHVEKSVLHRQFRELKRTHRILLRELAQRREQIASEKAKCEGVQMLKFGQIIDLHLLEKVGADDGAEELRSKLRALESSSVQKSDAWDEKIEQAKNELSQITEQNTRWLDKVAKLTKAQYDLEDTLNATTKNVHVADSSPLDDAAELERKQLLELVQLQEREVDALKSEIFLLRRKGGHVYTPQQ